MKTLLLVAGALAPIAIPQDSVLPVYGCGTGCRIETEQLSLPRGLPIPCIGSGFEGDSQECSGLF